jgi:hypothetical protein
MYLYHLAVQKWHTSAGLDRGLTAGRKICGFIFWTISRPGLGPKIVQSLCTEEIGFGRNRDLQTQAFLLVESQPPALCLKLFDVCWNATIADEAWIEQSVQRLVADWRPIGRSSISRIFSSPCRPDRHCSSPSLLSNEYRWLFSRVKAAEAWN